MSATQSQAVDPLRLWNTRLQLHWAAQAAAGVGRSLLPHHEDFSHESFHWSQKHRALLQASTDGENRFRAGIRIRDICLLILDENDVPIDEMPMNDRTLDKGFAFFENHADSQPLGRPPEGMPEHPVVHGAVFNVDMNHLRELERYYSDAATMLEQVRCSEQGAGPVRCWPHHFDIATLITISGEGEHARTIGVGMAPGDESYREPYYYVTPWPRPEVLTLPRLTHGAWHSVDWFGATLPASQMIAQRGPGNVIPMFLQEAIQHCRLMGQVETARQS